MSGAQRRRELAAGLFLLAGSLCGAIALAGGGAAAWSGTALCVAGAGLNALAARRGA